MPVAVTEAGHRKIAVRSVTARRASSQLLGGSHGGKWCWDEVGKLSRHLSTDQIPGEGKAGGGRGPQTFQTQKKPRVFHVTGETAAVPAAKPLAGPRLFVLSPFDDSVNSENKAARPGCVTRAQRQK